MLSSQRLKFQLIFSAGVAVLALVITGVGYYLDWDNELANAWATTLFLPFVLSAIISGNPHSPSMAIFIFILIVQWAFIGFFLSIPMSRLFSPRQNK